MHRLLIFTVAAFLLMGTPVYADDSETVDLQSKIQALLDQVEKFDRKPDGEVMRELLSYGTAIIKPIERRLNNTDRPLAQKYYLILLYGTGDQGLTKTVMPFMQSNDNQVRLWALYNLAKYGDTHSVATLIQALGDTAVPVDAKELAADRLKDLTGENIEYRATMDARQRDRAYQNWQEWLKTRQSGEFSSRPKT